MHAAAPSIVVITRDEPFLVPVYLSRLVAERGADIAHVFINRSPSPHLGKGKLLRLCGPLGFARMSLRFALHKLLGATGLRRPCGHYYSLRALLRSHRVPYSTGFDPGAPQDQARLRDMAPAVVLSIANSKILPPALLSMPQTTFINVHGSLLPHYKGILTAFWMLHDEARAAGVTLHEMVEDVDAGKILNQAEVPIRPGDTVMGLYHRIAVAGGELIPRTIAELEAGTLAPLEQPQIGEGLRLVPTDEDILAFRKRGGRFA